jgi:hypothetical protein
MKQKYIKPTSRIFQLQGPVLMVSGSVEVTDYKRGDTISIGDDDS